MAASIRLGTRVEVAPHYNIWMQGDCYGVVEHILSDGKTALVRMDKSRRLLSFPIPDLTDLDAKRDADLNAQRKAELENNKAVADRELEHMMARVAPAYQQLQNGVITYTEFNRLLIGTALVVNELMDISLQMQFYTQEDK